MYPIFLLVSSCFLFSVLAALIKFGSQFIHPIEQAFFRNLISILLLIPFVIQTKKIINKSREECLKAFHVIDGDKIYKETDAFFILRKDI